MKNKIKKLFQIIKKYLTILRICIILVGVVFLGILVIFQIFPIFFVKTKKGEQTTDEENL